MMMFATGAISIKEFIAFAERESWCNEDDEAYDSFAYSLNKAAMMTLSNSPTNMNKQATLRGTRGSLLSNGAWLDGDVNDINDYDSDIDDANAANALVHGMKVSSYTHIQTCQEQNRHSCTVFEYLVHVHSAALCQPKLSSQYKMHATVCFTMMCVLQFTQYYAMLSSRLCAADHWKQAC
jgi:hypothetical protein